MTLDELKATLASFPTEQANNLLVWGDGLSEWIQAKDVAELTRPSLPPPLPTNSEVRAGIQQAKVGEHGFTILSAEAALIGAIAGVRAQSWGVGIGACLFTFVLVVWAANAPPLISKALAWVIGFAWGLVAYYALQGNDSAIVVAVVAGLVGAGGHLTGFQYVRDLQRAKG